MDGCLHAFRPPENCEWFSLRAHIFLRFHTHTGYPVSRVHRVYLLPPNPIQPTHPSHATPPDHPRPLPRPFLFASENDPFVFGTENCVQGLNSSKTNRCIGFRWRMMNQGLLRQFRPIKGRFHSWGTDLDAKITQRWTEREPKNGQNKLARYAAFNLKTFKPRVKSMKVTRGVTLFFGPRSVDFYAQNRRFLCFHSSQPPAGICRNPAKWSLHDWSPSLLLDLYISLCVFPCFAIQ